MTDTTAELSGEEQFVAALAKTSEPAVPAVEPATTEPEAQPEARHAEPPAPAPEDPFAGWPEAAKAKFLEAEARAAKAEQERQAAVGRLAPIQRQLSELQRTSAAPKATPAPRPAPPKRDSFYDSQDWKDFERDYPDEAKRQRKALEFERNTLIEEARRIAREEAGLVRNELGQFVSPHIARFEQIEQRERVAKLTQEHPNWHEHFRLVPQHDESGKVVDYEAVSSPAFDAWFDALDDLDQDTVRDRLWSDDPKHCSWVIRKFERETQPIESAANTQAAQKAEARRNHFESSVSPNLKPAPVPARIHAPDLSGEEQFAAALRQNRKR